MEPEIKLNPKHKKNAEVGEKKTVYSSNILVEQEDAASFDDNEEVSNIAIICLYHVLILPLDHLDGLG